ncbi:MAG: hypothetical protein AB1609_19715 [Bacillota bacterium]
MALMLHPAPKVSEAVQVVNGTRDHCGKLMEKIRNCVRAGMYVGAEDQLGAEGWYRGVFKILMNRRSYKYDAHIRFEFTGPELEVGYLFFVAVRAWDRRRPSGKPDTEYLREAIDYAAALGPPAHSYRLAIWDWERKPFYWDVRVADVAQLLDAWRDVVAKWQRNDHSEMVIEHRVPMRALLEELGLASGPQEGSVQVSPAHTEALAERIAAEFDRFITTLDPKDLIDHD